METNSSAADQLLKPITYGTILDARDLLREYSAECSIPELGETNPQREMYAAMEKGGLMHSFGVYEQDDLIGFATLLIFMLPHYGKRVANVESFFLTQAHRSGSRGRQLMAQLERFAREQQCSGLFYNARSGSKLERLLSALPYYQRTNSVFLRNLA